MQRSLGDPRVLYNEATFSCYITSYKSRGTIVLHNIFKLEGHISHYVTKATVLQRYE